jgi:hypothetical protein
MALSTDRNPNWGTWAHVPSVTLPEAVALSLNIDPHKLRPNPHSWKAGRLLFQEGLEFENRLMLAERCLGETLPGPVNKMAVRYYDTDALVRLPEFAAWAQSVEWQIPAELARLSGNDRKQPTNARNPNEGLTLPSQRSGASGEAEVLVGRPNASDRAKQAEPCANNEADTHSGFPGRPGKAKHQIEDEFKRRPKAGEALPNLADEAAALLDWLKEAHPSVPRPTQKTIENNIRNDHRRWPARREADPP